MPGEFSEFFEMFVPCHFEVPNFCWIFRSKIRCFSTVTCEVVKFPGAISFLRDEFPIAHADGAVAGVIPPKVIVGDGTILLQNRHQAETGCGWNRLAIPLRRFPATGKFED